MSNHHPEILALNRVAEDIWQDFYRIFPGLNIEICPSIDSTNTELARRARRGDASSSVIVALEQTAGRGRQGKTWHNRSGDCLMFSLSHTIPSVYLSGLSLMVGISAARALQSFDNAPGKSAQYHPQQNSDNPKPSPAPIGIKWPNDLWLRADERKLGGILVEALAIPASAGEAQRYCIMGLGLNVRRSPEGAAALCELDPRWTLAAAFERVLRQLLVDLQDFSHSGLRPFLPAFAALDLLHGRDITLWPTADAAASSTSAVCARAAGIDATGQLHAHEWGTGRELMLHNGDFSVRPRSSA